MASVPGASDPESRSLQRLYGPDGHTVRVLQADVGGAVPAVPPANAPAPPAETKPAAPTPTTRSTPRPRAKTSRSKTSSARRASAKTHAEPASFTERVRESLDHGKEWIEAAAIEIRGASALLFLWKRLGLKGLLLVLLVLGGPIGEYSVFSRFVNATLPQMAGNFGVEIEAEDWSYHPFALKAVARNVKVRPEHDKRATPVFTAAEVEFQGTIRTVAAGVWELVTGNWVHTFNEIDIRHAQLQLERSMTGDLNWTSYVDAVPAARRAELSSGSYRINGLSIEDLRISYVEHIAGNSGAGIIETAQANIFIDSIKGSITDIKPLELKEELPTRISFDGRSADGTLEVRGKFGLVPSARSESSEPELKKASYGKQQQQTGPFYDVTVALSNIGVGAYATMVPATRLVPSRGNVHGRIRFVNLPANSTPPCFSDLRATDVRYAPNPRFVTRPAEFSTLQQQAANYITSGPFDLCRHVQPQREILPNGEERYRNVTSASILAAFNEQTTANAPPALRQAVALDSENVAGSFANAALQDVTSKMTDRLGQEVSKVLGPQTGAVLRQSLSGNGTTGTKGTTPAPEGNAISKGAKSVGRSFKRLFGGGKKEN